MTILHKVLLDFGFSNQESQLALLNIFNCAGYFSDKNLWQAINLMEFNQDGKKETSAWKAGELNSFLAIKRVLDLSGANQKNVGFFNAKYFLENAFIEADIFDIEDVQDLLLYLGQTAFGRAAGQERSDLVECEWMKTYAKEYLENAKILGFINEKKPHYETYHESWIQGGARSRMVSRISYLKKLQEMTNFGIVRILTGSRELSIELDKISDDEEEVKNFICEVAKENNIKYDLENPFIQKTFGEAIKTCLNYIGDNGVTEAMMAKKIYRELFKEEVSSVVDSIAVGKIGRPTTQKNAQDIIEGELFLRIKNGDFLPTEPIKILIVSNQPYCNRQVGTINRATSEIMNKKLLDKEINYKYQLIFDGVGEASDSTVVQVHSVFGALISEDFLMVIADDKNNRKRNIDSLMFISRRNDIEIPLPQIK